MVGCSITNDQLADYRLALIGRFGEAAFRSWMSDLCLEKSGGEEVEISTESPIRREALLQRFKPGMHDEWNRLGAPAKRFSISLRQRRALSQHAQEASVRTQPPSEVRFVESRGDGPGIKSNFGFNGGANGGQHPAKSAGFPSVIMGQRGTNERAGAKKTSLSLTELASPLDERTTFDTFAIDDTNRIAHAAARQVFVEGSAHNLIYIYGPSGVGKTHLLHAVGHEWRTRHGEGDFAYLTHSNLTNGCVDAVWSNSMHSLHKDLLSHRLVMIDDIHMLGGKERTQQEMLNLVNAFIASGRQLVVAGEAAPSLLKQSGVHERLADRLAGGLAVSIDHGGVELRQEVLKKRVDMACHGLNSDLEVREDAIDYVARNFSQSMREAIGALNQLLLDCGERGGEVGRMDAEAALQGRLTNGKQLGTLEDAALAAAEAFGITIDDIKGRAQPQRIVKARHAFVFVCRDTLKESFPRIAGVLGRDHTTAMSSFRRAEALLERHKDFQDAVDRIRRAIGG